MSARNADAPLAEVHEVVVFILAGQRYALPIEAVQEIQQIVAMGEVPDRTPGLVGVVNLRGEVVPAIDMRQLFGMDERPLALETPMIITHSLGGLVALIVDEVEDVATIPAGCMQRPDEIYELADRMLGVCRLETEFVFVLDPHALVPQRAAVATPDFESASAPKRKAVRSSATRKKAT